MKMLNKTISIALALIMLMAMPITAQASASAKSPYNSNTYTIAKSQTDKKILHGIDVSEHNGDINWSKVRENVDFVIIRIGYRGYGSSGKVIKDERFDENIKKAKENKIPVGIYFYSQAITTAEAKEEANLTIKWLGKNDLDYPIFYDYEFASVYTGRLDSAWRTGKLNKDKMTDNALAFMNAVHSTGRDAMIYASRCFLQDNVDHKEITENGYGIWVAEYNKSTPFEGKYVGWQYSDNGKIDGISGRVDCNFWFVDKDVIKPKFTVEPIKDCYYSGSKQTPSPVVMANDEMLVLDEDYTVKYENNKNVGTGRVIVEGIGKYSGYRKTQNFDILPKTVTNLKMTEKTTNSISVSWDKDDYTCEYDVQVYRGGKWTSYATTTKHEIDITNLKSATIYNVRVRARRNSSYGIEYVGKYCTDIKEATIPEKLKKPTATSSESSIKLSWSKLENATGYQLYKYDSKKDKFYLLKDTNASTFTDANLKSNSSNKYKVRAYKRDSYGNIIYGKFSSSVTAYTSPAVPSLKSATSPRAYRIQTGWSKVSGVTGYQVQWSTTKDFSSNTKLVFVKGADVTSKTISTAQRGRQYYVRVRAYKTRNDIRYYSKWSNTVGVKVK